MHAAVALDRFEVFKHVCTHDMCLKFWPDALNKSGACCVRVLVSKYKKCMLCALVPRPHLPLVSLSESCRNTILLGRISASEFELAWSHISFSFVSFFLVGGQFVISTHQIAYGLSQISPYNRIIRRSGVVSSVVEDASV